MSITLAMLAQWLDAELVGDGAIAISGANVPAHARPGDITLVDRPERLKLLQGTKASAVVVPPTALPAPLPALVVEDVHRAFMTIIGRFRPARVRRRVGVSPAAHIAAGARLAADVDVYPGAVIEEDVEIGPGATIFPNAHIMAGCRIGAGAAIYAGAVLYEDTVVGPRSIIHAHAVIGCNGFGYNMVDGHFERAAQLGHVEIGEDVEIGAGTTIDRGAYGPTVIGDGTKIDNQVQIAHNCAIGRHNMLCSQVGIAGSTTTGDYVVMAGQVGVRDHVHIGDRAVLGAKAGVSNDIAPDTVQFGAPATPERQQKLILAAMSKLPDMRRELRALQKSVEQLEKIVGAAEGDRPARPSAA